MTSFRPPWYLRSGHVQTILTSVHRPKAHLENTIVHQVPLDGDLGATCIYENRPDDFDSFNGSSNSQAVLLLHGLGSSHGGTYMTNVAAGMVAAGHRVIRLDLPGSGPSSKLTWMPAHGGCSEQVWTILRWCHANLGITDWRAAGFSLGGNILLRLLGTHADDLRNQSVPWSFSKAVAVAPPIDLGTCSSGMEGPINQVYARYFLKVLMAEVTRRSIDWPQWAGIARDPWPKTIRGFDERFTAKIAGFKNAEDYYQQASSQPWLGAIQTPIKVLCDRHDPIVPARIFLDMKKHSSIEVTWTRRGGHLGYFYRADDGRLVRWADQWVIDQLTRSTPA